MNAMNMPGFAAEASVYKTRGHYWVATTTIIGIERFTIVFV